MKTRAVIVAPCLREGWAVIEVGPTFRWHSVNFHMDYDTALKKAASLRKRLRSQGINVPSRIQP